MQSKGRLPKELIEQIREMAETQGLSSKEIGLKVGKSAHSIQRTFRRYNMKCRPACSCPLEKNPAWKGGIHYDHGYRLLRFPEHPFSNSAGYVREHRLVMEKHLGRYLLPTEVVHHKDENPLNNELSNLELYRNNAEHLRVELSGKIPKWSEDGYLRILKGVAQALKTRGSSTIPQRRIGAL